MIMIPNGRNNVLIKQHDETMVTPPSSTEHKIKCSEIKLLEQEFIVLISSEKKTVADKVGLLALGNFVSCRRKSRSQPVMIAIIKSYWNFFQS
jgi:hypothetical protein